MSPLSVTVIVIAVLIVVAAAILYIRKERTKRLRNQFGPEYDRLVTTRGNREKAEEELLGRVKRIRRFHIRDLKSQEVDRFSSAWSDVQARFVDAPRQAVAQADRLIHDVMKTRGYPMSDFERSAADISLDHARVVQNYRAAHDLAERDAAGQTTTEDLRQAMVHYRALFEDLLGSHSHVREEVKR
jgi:hypothetical protein